MFSVYGLSGRVFGGTLEQMRQVSAVSEAARTRALRPAGREASGGAAGSGDGRAAAAAVAYRQAEQAGEQRQPLTRVEQVMTRGAVLLSYRLPLQEAARQLAAQGIGQAPVVDDAGVLVGLLLRRDLPADAGVAGAAPKGDGRRVADFMRTPVPGVAAQTDLRVLAGVLLDTGLPGLPVCEADGAVIGFVSRTDILRAVAADPPLDLWS